MRVVFFFPKVLKVVAAVQNTQVCKWEEQSEETVRIFLYIVYLKTLTVCGLYITKPKVI